MSSMVIKLGKGKKKKPLWGVRKSSDVNSRSLGDKIAPEPPNTSINTSHTKSKLRVKWPKFKHFMRKRGASSSTDHTGIDLFKQVSSNQSNEAIDGSNTELPPSLFGMCGATENVSYRPISPQEQQELLSQLDEYKQQVHLLNEELEEVNREKEAVVERLDKLMNTKTMLNPVQLELEDIRLMLSITEGEGLSTLSSQTIPFYTFCSCVDN